MNIQQTLEKAKKEGRICACGWLITVIDWKKGHRLCKGCRDAKRGVNVSYGHGPYEDEPRDMTGEE